VSVRTHAVCVLLPSSVVSVRLPSFLPRFQTGTEKLSKVGLIVRPPSLFLFFPPALSAFRVLPVCTAVSVANRVACVYGSVARPIHPFSLPLFFRSLSFSRPQINRPSREFKSKLAAETMFLYAGSQSPLIFVFFLFVYLLSYFSATQERQPPE